MNKDSYTIRIASADDATAIRAIYAGYIEHTAITFEYDVPSVEEMQHRITDTLQKYPYLVAEIDGQIVGYAYAGAFHKRMAYAHGAELSIYLRQDVHRLGLGRRLYRLLELILEQQNVCNLYACVAKPRTENDPHLPPISVRFHTAVGFAETAFFANCGYKFDQWYDMVWLEKMIGEHQSPMPAFRPFEPEMAENAFQRQ